MGLLELKQKIQSKAKGVHVSVLSESTIATTKQWLPTPALDLNRILSGSLFKGLLVKTFTMLVGPEASFKSSFMCLCLAEAQRQGYTPVIIDTEGAWTADFVTRWGLDPTKILYIYCPWVDDILLALGQIIDSGDENLALAVDSIGGIDRKKVLDDALKGDVKADQGTLQKEIKRMLKMILYICKGQNSLALASGHYYGNPGGYGDPEQIGGGKFARLAPDIIIGLKKNKIYDDPTAAAKDRIVIGSEIRACTLKNRIYPPFQEATVEIDFNKGINRLAGMVDLGLSAGFFTRGGAWYTNTLTGKKCQGMAGLLESIDEDCLQKIEEFLQKSGYSTVNESIKAAEEILNSEAEAKASGDDEFADETSINKKKK